MATLYPDCKFTAVELASEQIQVLPELPNVTYERGDVLETGLLSIKNESIDYVHLRSAGSLVKKHCWPKIFAEINRILKPDGVIRIEEMHHSVSNLHINTYLIPCLLNTCIYIASWNSDD